MTSHSFKPLITKPTRITSTTATLIDHIWTNDLRLYNHFNSTITITDITDHLPCITSIKNEKYQTKGYKIVNKRIITDQARTNFVKEVELIKDALSFHAKNEIYENLNEKYECYFDHIKRLYEKTFPIKKVRIHSKNLSKPWMTEDIRIKLNKQNKLFSKKLKINKLI